MIVMVIAEVFGNIRKGLGGFLNFRTAGESEAQDAGGFVERLPGRVVASAAEQAVFAVPLHEHQVGMAA